MRANNHLSISRGTTVVALSSFYLLSACTTQPDHPEYPEGLAGLPFIQPGWSQSHGSAMPGRFYEIKRPKLRGVSSEGIPLPIDDEKDEPEDISGEEIPEPPGSILNG